MPIRYLCPNLAYIIMNSSHMDNLDEKKLRDMNIRIKNYLAGVYIVNLNIKLYLTLKSCFTDVFYCAYLPDFIIYFNLNTLNLIYSPGNLQCRPVSVAYPFFIYKRQSIQHFINYSVAAHLFTNIKKFISHGYYLLYCLSILRITRNTGCYSYFL